MSASTSTAQATVTSTTSLIHQAYKLMQAQTRPGTLVGDNKIVSLLALAFLVRLGQAGFDAIPNDKLKDQLVRSVLSMSSGALACLLTEDAITATLRASIAGETVANYRPYVAMTELFAATHLTRAAYCIAKEKPIEGRSSFDRALLGLLFASYGALLSRGGAIGVVEHSGASSSYYNTDIPFGLAKLTLGGLCTTVSLRLLLPKPETTTVEQDLNTVATAAAPKSTTGVLTTLTNSIRKHAYLATVIPVMASGTYLIKRSVDYFNGLIPIPQDEKLQFELPRFGAIASLSNNAANVAQIVLGSGLVIGGIEYVLRKNKVQRTVLKSIAQAVKRGYQTVTDVCYKALDALHVPAMVRAFISSNIVHGAAKIATTAIGVGSTIDGARRLVNNNGADISTGKFLLQSAIGGTEIALGLFGTAFGLNCIETVDKLQQESESVLDMAGGALCMGTAATLTNFALSNLQNQCAADSISYKSVLYGYLAALFGGKGIENMSNGIAKWRLVPVEDTQFDAKLKEIEESQELDEGQKQHKTRQLYEQRNQLRMRVYGTRGVIIGYNQIHAAALAAMSYKWGADCYRMSTTGSVNRFDNLVYRGLTATGSVSAGLACFGFGAKIYDIILLAGFAKAAHLFFTQYNK